MKGMDIFCASQAATAICLSMEGEGGGASSSTFPFCSSGRTIDRYNPIIRDPRRLGIGKTVPSSSSSQSPLDAAAAATPGLLLLNPRNNNIAVKKNSSSSSSSNSNSKTNNIINELQKKRKKKKKKSTAAKSSSNSGSAPADFDVDVDVDVDDDHHRGIFTTRTTKSWRCTTKPGDFFSPPGSSRYLLSDQPKFLNVISDFDPVLKLVPVEETSNTAQVVLKNDDDDDDVKLSPSPSPKPPPPSSSSSRSPQDQVVVVLKVSLHCKGCERKMRKHLSRMEGVSSFNIDFAAKKVTVVGNVTPLGVLNSISKVKSAQLWNPSISTPPPPATIKNNNNSAGMMKPPPSHFHSPGM